MNGQIAYDSVVIELGGKKCGKGMGSSSSSLWWLFFCRSVCRQRHAPKSLKRALRPLRGETPGGSIYPKEKRAWILKIIGARLSILPFFNSGDPVAGNTAFPRCGKSQLTIRMTIKSASWQFRPPLRDIPSIIFRHCKRWPGSIT